MIVANGVLVTDSQVNLLDLGIDTLKTEKAEAYFKKSQPSVIGLHVEPDTLDQVLQLIEELTAQPKKRQYILISKTLDPSGLCRLIAAARPHRVLDSLDKEQLTRAYKSTFQIHFERDQTESLADLIGEKNDELKRLTIALEDKVKVRQQHLEASIEKNLSAEKRLKLLKKTMVYIYKAQSLSEIEHGITEALKSEFDILNVKIRQQSQSNIQDLKKTPQFSVSLKSGKRDYGFLTLQSQRDTPFSKEEKKLFTQIAESVALSIEKSFQIQKEQDLSRQWAATFDAISDPVCLTDSQYNILRINKAFQKKVGLQGSASTLYGKKCYRVLFDRESVCNGCSRGTPFRLQAESPRNGVFNVHSNSINDHQGLTYFQIYRDITQSLNLERQVIESAKMAELGTISSSIAHELNNPIGGMLNFLQLIKMDLNGDEPYFSDIVEIEKGTLKCKTIVQNLLGFSRKSNDHGQERINLIEVLEQAIKITELKTRAVGISIHRHYEAEDCQIEGWFNLLAHTFRNILQNAQESILEKRRQQKHYKGAIDVHVQVRPEGFSVVITDDGVGLDPDLISKVFDPLYSSKDASTHSGLGLTLAQQIVLEHNGLISLTSNKDKKISVTVRLNKAEVES